MTALHDMLCQSLFEAKPDELDLISSVDVQIHDVIAEADSMVWDFDLKDLWLTKSRWTMMVNQYIDADELEVWINKVTSRIGTTGRGVAVMRTKIVQPRGGKTNSETRRWGSCMLAFSYKALPRPQITMISRTSYLGYIGALDMTVAWMVARYLGEALGLEVEDFSFVWMNQALQWHNFKSLAYLLSHHDPELRKHYRRLMTKKLEDLEPDELAKLEQAPGLAMTRKWVNKMMDEDRSKTHYGQMTYNTYRRIRRRWHTEIFGYEFAQRFEGWSLHKKGPQEGEQKEFFKAYLPLPNCPVSTLDLGMLVKKGADLSGLPFAGEEELDDDDDE